MTPMHCAQYRRTEKFLCCVQGVMMQEQRHMKKFILTATALVALAATPAFAKTHHTSAAAAATSNEAFGSYAAVTADPDTVIVNGQYVGRDPDLDVRLNLERDPGLAAD
jgi:hypothetical protein